MVIQHEKRGKRGTQKADGINSTFLGGNMPVVLQMFQRKVLIREPKEHQSEGTPAINKTMGLLMCQNCDSLFPRVPADVGQSPSLKG